MNAPGVNGLSLFCILKSFLNGLTLSKLDTMRWAHINTLIMYCVMVAHYCIHKTFASHNEHVAILESKQVVGLKNKPMIDHV